MSKNKKIDQSYNKDNQENVHWLKSYKEDYKTDDLKSLKNKDILNYIKDIKEKCRLEVSSGDEDYAGTKRSSDCSVRFSDTKFRPSRKGKSKILSKRNKNAVSREKRMKRFSTRFTNSCNYCCSSQKSSFCKKHVLTNKENSEMKINTFVKSIRHYPISSSKQNSHKYEPSPKFYGSYSRRDHKMWPSVTKRTSFEVVQNAIPDSTVNESRSTNRKKFATNVRTSLHRRRLGDSTYANIYSNITCAERQQRDPYYRKRAKDTQMIERLESDISDFTAQQPLDEFHSDGDTTDKLAHSYLTTSRKKRYKEYPYTFRYRYPVRRSGQPTSWDPSSRSNRLSAWPLEISSQKRALQLRRKVGFPLRASSSIIGTSINRSYRRTQEEPNRYKTDTNQRRREHISGVRGPSYYLRPKTTDRLYKMTRESSCFKDVGQEEIKCSEKCCCCSENLKESIQRNYPPQRESGKCREVRIGKLISYADRETEEALSKPKHSRNNDEAASDFDLLEEDSRGETVTYDKSAFDRSDEAKNYNDKIEDSEPGVSLPDDRVYRERRLNDEFNNRLREEQKSRGKISRGEFSREIKTSEKLALRDSSRYDVAEFMCNCREPFHDFPACLAGSCTCIKNNEDAEKDDSDSWVSTVCSCCCCCCSSSASSYGEKDPVKKLESFCEKVKAMNQDMFDKPLTYYDAARTNTQRYYDGGDRRNQSATGNRTAGQGSIEGKWLENPLCRRLARPKYDRTKLEKILIYPPQGETGLPLTLYKKSSNINCRVKGEANAGFRYTVTYVQKFVSPLWTPDLPSEVPSQEIDEECDCSADYG